ncbi:uncharacterized protein LOC101859978 [Aplysia californica]|uniref:Uncharacterized protein LOC101859978 n=1 Tax=Aplysia californica TaxID=6500 RepID=A0ABM1W1X4_APLCA|nr:uncharacterized protein LOC101859978 [Aplysia californica]
MRECPRGEVVAAKVKVTPVRTEVMNSGSSGGGGGGGGRPLASTSSTSITSTGQGQGSAGSGLGQGQGRGPPSASSRGNSAKYYDIASTILGGSGDVELVLLNAAKNGNYSKLEQLLEKRKEFHLDINCKDKRTGNTALMWAAKRGHSRTVEILLRHGADPTLCNYEAQTALELAFSPVKTVLLDWVENSTELTSRRLLQAAWQGNVAVVRAILDSRQISDVNCQNAEGLTPLMLVSRDVQLFERLSVQLNRHYSPVEVAAELMKANANIHVTDNDGRSSLHYASQSRAGVADRLVTTLITGGMDIELQDKRLFTPIHLASQLGNTDNVVALLDGGSEVNIKGFGGLTPLHMTAFNDHHKTAVTLLNRGADVQLVDDRGLTPLDLAKTRKMKVTLKEAWTEATKVQATEAGPETTTPNNKQTNDGPSKKKSAPPKKKPEVIFDDLVSSPAKTPAPTPKNGVKILSNVERCKQAERKILQEVEALKAAHPVLQRESTRMLGTTRSKILPQIGRSTSPEYSQSQGHDRESPRLSADSVLTSLEDARHQLMSRGRSMSDIKLGVGRQSMPLSSPWPADEGRLDEIRTPVSSRPRKRSKNRHRRSGSDPPMPNMADLAVSCDHFLPSPHQQRNSEVEGGTPKSSQKLSSTAPEPVTFITQSSSPLDSKGYKDFSRLDSPFELLRSRSIFKEEFILEESRPREMHSGSYPTSSSGSSLSSSSPRDQPSVPHSPGRSLKRDPSLSTLQELHASGAAKNSPVDKNQNFVVSKDSENCIPVIKEQSQRVRRKSENSALNSRTRVLRIGPSSALKHAAKGLSSDENSNVLQDGSGSTLGTPDQTSLMRKSQSLDNVSPRFSSPQTSYDEPLSQRFCLPQGSSRKKQPSASKDTSPKEPVSNENTSRENSLKKSVSNETSSQNAGSRSVLEKSKASVPNDNAQTLNAAKSSAQKPVAPFSGKIRVVQSTEMENWDKDFIFDTEPSEKTKQSSQASKISSGKSRAALALNKSVQNPQQGTPSQRSARKSSLTSKSYSGPLSQRSSGTAPAGESDKRPQTSCNDTGVARDQGREDASLTEREQTFSDMQSMPPQPGRPPLSAKPAFVTQVLESSQESTADNSQEDPVASNTAASIGRKDAGAYGKNTHSRPGGMVSSKSTPNLRPKESGSRGAMFVVTEESERKGSASKQRQEERAAIAKQKAKETAQLNSPSVREGLPENSKTESVKAKLSNKAAAAKEPVVNKGCESARVRSVNKAASLEKTILTHQTKNSALTSQQTKAKSPLENSANKVRSSQDSLIGRNNKSSMVTKVNPPSTSETSSSRTNASASKNKSSVQFSMSNRGYEQNKAGQAVKEAQPSLPASGTRQKEKSSVLPTQNKQSVSKSVDSTQQAQSQQKPKESSGSAPSKQQLKPNPNTAINPDPQSQSHQSKTEEKSVITTSPIDPNIILSPRKNEPLVKIKFLSHTTTPSSPQSIAETADVTSSTYHHNAQAISTPLIVNPFENFLQAHIKTVENSSKDAVVKMKKVPRGNTGGSNKTSKKSSINSSSNKRPTSGGSRQNSAGKKLGTRGKDSKSEKEARPKSCKRGRGISGKKKKQPETTATEISSEAQKPDVALISGIGWQLSTSCIDKSDVKVNDEIDLHSSDSEWSNEEDSRATDGPVTAGRSHDNLLNKHMLEAFKEKITLNSPRFLEMKRRQESQLDLKLPIVTDDGFPPMNLDMTQHSHNQAHARGETELHFGLEHIGESEDVLCDMTHVGSQHNNDIQREILMGKLTPIPEVSMLSKTAEAITEFDKTVKDSQLAELLGETSSRLDHHEREKEKKRSANKSRYIKEKSRSSGIEEKTVRNDAIHYEYTASGKTIRRTQSLKEGLNVQRPRRERTFSETKDDEKRDAAEEEIDEAIEEILSNTTSSMNSTLRSVTHKLKEQPHSGAMSLTDGDRSILLKLKSSSSPFHARSAELNSGVATDHQQDVGSNSSTSRADLEVGDRKQVSAAKQNSHDKSGAKSSAQNTVSSARAKESVAENSGKPPVSVRASRSKQPLQRSASLRASQESLAVEPVMLTEEEARQLAKVMNSFRHMELHASGHVAEGTGGSAKMSSRQGKGSLVAAAAGDYNLVPRPASTGAAASSKVKGKFHELKQSVVVSVAPREAGSSGQASKKAKDVSVDKQVVMKEEESLLECIADINVAPEVMAQAPSLQQMCEQLSVRRGSLAGSECTVDSVQSTPVEETIQWKKGNILGRGAFGTVWCGLTNEGQLIAVKQIELTTKDIPKAQHEYEKIQEEVELLKTLEHINIVGYLGTSLEESTVSIFMQFIPGGSIASILARFGALDESVFRRYTRQILEGVEYLHENDVIHRDIKGANVMLMPNGVIKLIDFGCAKRLCINLSISQTEILKSMKGTPFWMAPEVVNETGHGKKSDIWSIGCTVFEMATRKPPWADMNPMAAIFAIGSADRPVPSLPEKFSLEARDFISECLTRDQEKRPSASQLLDHLFITRRNSRRNSKTNA